MIPAGGFADFPHGSAAKFAAPDHDSVLEQTAAGEIARRHDASGAPVLTDGGHAILDLRLGRLGDAEMLQRLAGLAERAEREGDGEVERLLAALRRSAISLAP